MKASTTKIVRNRVLAVLLGITLTASLAGAFAYWEMTYVQGQETCANCRAQRDVARRGPFWFRSEPRLRGAGSETCPEHDWVRTGCWSEDGSQGLYGPVPRR
jgi:hypothetical protein